jgi:polysaccharide export outer membrane protein
MLLSMNLKISRLPGVLTLTLVSTVLAGSMPALAGETVTSQISATDAQLRNKQNEDSDLLSPLPSSDETIETVDSPEGEMLPSTPPVTPSEPSNFFEENPDSRFTIDEAQSGLTGYLLGPGDQLGITVVGIDELERNRIVLPDGTILLPLVGAVPAAGKTLVELEQDITRRLSFYVVEPVVEVNLNTLRPVVVTVAGEVNRPGPVQLNSLSTFNTRVDTNAQLTSSTTSPTLSTALVGAGGVARTADLRDITVRRLLPDGREVSLKVNLWETLFEGQGESNILLQDGDVVFVPEASPTAVGINPQIVARSSLAPETVRVRVIGEVLDPGEVEVPADGSVSSALAIAGGYDTDTADLSQVALLRLQDNGQVEEQIIDMNANLVDGTPIQEGDMIVVPKRGYLNTLDTISRTLSPITAPFNFLLLIDNFFDNFDDNNN